MSYCVNCGVELASSEHNCPLCGTEVINPRDPWREPKSRPYPAYFEAIMRGIDRRYLCSIIGLLLLIPVAVCLLVDVLADAGLNWSLYVMGAVLVIMVAVLLPISVGKPRHLLFLGCDTVAILAYLFLINLLSDKQWFLPLALPITLACSLFTLLVMIYFRQRKEKGLFVALAVMLFASGGLTMAIEIIIKHQLNGNFMPKWSWYAFVPCVLSGLIFIIINRQKKWKESIRKRLFF